MSIKTTPTKSGTQIKRNSRWLAVISWIHQMLLVLLVYLAITGFIGMSQSAQLANLGYLIIPALPLAIWDWFGHPSGPKPLYFAAFPVAYLYQVLSGQGTFLKLILCLLIMDVFCYYLYTYIQSVTKFIDYSEERSNFPLYSLRRNGLMTLTCILLVVLVILLPAMIGSDDPINQLTLPSLRTQQETPKEDTPAEEYTEEQSSSGGGMGEIMANMKDGPVILQKIARVTEPVMIGVIVVIVAIMVFRLMLSLWKKLTSIQLSNESDQVIFLRDAREDDTISRIHKNNRLSFFGTEAEVRRRYKREIHKHLKEKPKGWESPRELETAAGITNDTLHQEYEEVRYRK